MDRFAQLNTYHMTKFAYFLERLKATPDGDGTLLDHSLVLYGSSLSDGNQHNFSPLPIVLAGGASGQLKGGRHLQFPKDTRMSNLLAAMLNKLGVPTEKFGDGTRRARYLSGRGDHMTRRRRWRCASCSATVMLSVAAQAQAPVAQTLPLDNLGLEHLDIIVPDPAASAKFYARVFKTTLHQQPVRDTLRYFVLLGDLPADRQVGYIAIGAAGDRPPAIGHYCVLAKVYHASGFCQRAAGSGVAGGGDRPRRNRHVAGSGWARAAAVSTARRPGDCGREVPIAGRRSGRRLSARRRSRVVARLEPRTSLPYYRQLYGQSSRTAARCERTRLVST